MWARPVQAPLSLRPRRPRPTGTSSERGPPRQMSSLNAAMHSRESRMYSAVGGSFQ